MVAAQPALSKTTLGYQCYPPPPMSRFHLVICCGSSNFLHKVLVLGVLPSPCSCGSPWLCAMLSLPSADISLAFGVSLLAVLMSLSLLSMILFHWDRPLQQVPHRSLCRAVYQRLVDISPMHLLLSFCWLMVNTARLLKPVLSLLLATSLLLL